MNFQISKKIVVGLLSVSWLMMSGLATAQEEATPPPNPAEGTYFEKMRLNTQKFETLKTGNYLREDYICQSVPSACRDANAQEAEDRWYPALPAYTAWLDDGAQHSHESWLPAPTTQMSDFDQSQNYLQPQTRLRQEREQAVPSGDFRSIGEPQQENRDDSRVSTRNVTVNILTFVPDGNSFNCSTWLPDVGTVNLGEAFTQTRNCDQNAARDVEYYTGGNLLATSSDAGVVTIEETQPATGTRDFINGERADEWGEWVDSGELYGCSPWTPLPDTQPLESAFVQTAECSIDQTRERQVYNVFASGAETELRIDTENQTVDRQDSQDAIGAEDFIDSERIGDWKNVWEIVQPQVNTNCGPWSPLPSTVDWGNAFTQTRMCDTTEEDFRDIFDVYKSGREEVREVEQRTRVVQVEETQSETGARDFVESTYDIDGAWTNQGTLYNCVWTPDPDTIDIGETYTQNAECDRNQTRTITTYNEWASGQADTVASTRDENRTVKENASRSETGTGQPVIQYGTWGAYSTVNKTACTAWSPAESTVNLGASFTQNRTCTYNQERSRSRINLYPSGRTEALSPEVGTRALTLQAESRTNTGAQDYVTSTYNTFSNWTTITNDKSCTAWTPSTSTIDVGTSFTQERTCVDGQSRVRTEMQKWASGRADTPNGTVTETRDVNDIQSRTETGTGQPVIQYGAWGGWSTTATKDCTPWSPSVGSVAFGSSFTQNRFCTYDQERFRSRTNLYPSGRTESLSAQRETRALTNQPQSQSATGTQEQEVSTYVTYSSWTNSGNAYSCTWSPSPSTIDIGTSFTQTGSCSQNQTRVATTWSKWLSGKADSQKSTATESRTITTSPTRGSTGTGAPVISYGAWSGYTTVSKTACTTWSPAQSTVNLGTSFTQNRTCTYNQQRTRSRTNVYPSGRTEVLSPEVGTQSLTLRAESQTRTGTKDYVTSTYNTYTAWATIANDKTCTVWTPATSTIDIGVSFTQTRTCVDGQTRTRTAMQKWASGKADTANGTFTEARDVNDNQSRSSTGTGAPVISYGAWSGYTTVSKTACTTWSPAQSTVNLGTSFTQNRTCTYNQQRTRSRTNVYPSGRTEALSPEVGTQSLTLRAESQTSTGTKDYITSTYTTYTSWVVTRGDYNCTTWSPATSTRSCGTSFTQSRTCKNDQARTAIVMQRWASGKADTEQSRSTQTQTVDVTRTQAATGGAPTVSGTSYSYTAWTTYLNDQACTTWTPAASTGYVGQNVTQTRSCTDSQERNRTTVTTYSCGGATTYTGTIRLTQNITDNQTQVVAGTTDPWVAQSGRQCDVSTERNKGAPIYASGSSWSPTPSSRGISTASYTQSRAGIQAREYQCYNTETNAVTGVPRRVNVLWENAPNDSYTFSRAVGVTRTGPFNSGSPSYSTYSPATSTVCSGSSFTQSQTVTQARYYSYAHKVGTSTIYTLTGAAPSTSYTQSRTATGTKACGPVCKYDGSNFVYLFEEDFSEYGQYEEQWIEERWVYNGVVVYDYDYYWTNQSSPNYERTDVVGSKSGYSVGASKFYEYGSTGYGGVQVEEFEICK